MAFADIRLTSSAISDSIFDLKRLVAVLQPFRGEHPTDVLFMSCDRSVQGYKTNVPFEVVAVHTVTGGMKNYSDSRCNEND